MGVCPACIRTPSLKISDISQRSEPLLQNNPSSYSAMPICIDGKSKCSVGPSNDVRGTSARLAALGLSAAWATLAKSSDRAVKRNCCTVRSRWWRLRLDTSRICRVFGVNYLDRSCCLRIICLLIASKSILPYARPRLTLPASGAPALHWIQSATVSEIAAAFGP